MVSRLLLLRPPNWSMFSQIVVPVTGGALNCQRSPDSGQTTTSLPIGLANVLHEARQHTANFDDFLLAKRELAARNDRGVRGELKVIFHFGRRGGRHLQEFREVPLRRAAGLLGDVRRNRQGRATMVPARAIITRPPSESIPRANR